MALCIRFFDPGIPQLIFAAKVHIMKKRTFTSTAVIGILLILAILAATSCKKNLDDTKEEDETDTLNYIPRQGINYHYKFKSTDGQEFPFYKKLSGQKDSLGTKLFEVTTFLSFYGQQLTLKQKMFNKDFFTTTAVYRIEEWDRYISMLRQSLEQSGGALLEIKMTGIPFYMLMPNDARPADKVTFTGALQQSLYIKARSGSGQNAFITETTQTIKRHDGVAVKSEKITVAAGTFECMRWQYAVDNKVETKINGQVMNVLETSDNITLWTKAGIGELKVVTVNSKSGQSSSELTRIGD
jgi:hypothetical protein